MKTKGETWIRIHLVPTETVGTFAFVRSAGYGAERQKESAHAERGHQRNPSLRAQQPVPSEPRSLP